VGPELGVCLDPMHLFWMGMDPASCDRKKAFKGLYLPGSWEGIRVCQATRGPPKTVSSGKYFDQYRDRAWNYDSGFGHDMTVWKEIVIALRLTGYDRDIYFGHETLVGI